MQTVPGGSRGGVWLVHWNPSNRVERLGSAGGSFGNVRMTLNHHRSLFVVVRWVVHLLSHRYYETLRKELDGSRGQSARPVAVTRTGSPPAITVHLPFYGPSPCRNSNSSTTEVSCALGPYHTPFRRGKSSTSLDLQ